MLETDTDFPQLQEIIDEFLNADLDENILAEILNKISGQLE